jgi:DNA ligase D-like protein (predicted 3'-phosphoesterase)
MPLDEYRRKRDFSQTPEPSGKTPTRARRPGQPESLYFCVQKHLASRLHYDLRLEHNGVLLSWAVPKGPSLDHRDKHMAVQTEDHPYDYGDFEGVIPEGYGAGIVMLWDHGTWQPEVDDIDAALRKGDLKFTLDGYKLKGSWVLVRTRDRPDTAPSQRGRSWLLIKHRDFWSGPIDMTTFAPLSVKSEGDFDDILSADMPDLWVTGRPSTSRGGATGKMLQEIIQKAAVKIVEREEAHAITATGTKAGAARTQSRAASKRPASRRAGPTKTPTRRNS